jgi:glycosyltransferase involved in cell wall biosynthesis
MNYEVTIGIPVYRAVDYIEKTMESALNQSFESIEYLVVDDCGNDGTIDVVERLQKEHQRGKDIRILYNKQNLGVGKTRNVILEQAKGEYLYFLDSVLSTIVGILLSPQQFLKILKNESQISEFISHELTNIVQFSANELMTTSITLHTIIN